MNNIRRVAPGDAAAIGKVHFLAWQQAYGGLISDKYLASMSQEKSTAIFEKNSCRNMLVALREYAIIGFCGYGKARDQDLPGDFGEVQGIYVLKGFQRMGLGSRLLSQAKDELRSMGFKRACLWVLKQNLSALAFYKKHGFSPDGASKTAVLDTPVTEIRLTCVL